MPNISPFNNLDYLVNFRSKFEEMRTIINGLDVSPRAQEHVNPANAPTFVKFDGTTAGQASLFAAAVTEAKTKGLKLFATGTYLASTDSLDILDISADLSGLRIQEPASGRSATLLSMRGSTIGTKRETDTHCYGINKTPNPSLGEYDFQGVKSQATGVVITSDGNGGSRRQINVSRLAIGAVIEGNVEKQGELLIYGSGNGILCLERELFDGNGASIGSPDSNSIRLAGSLNKTILITANSTSGHYTIVHEARIDDGSFISEPWIAARNIPTPAIWIKSGKYHWIEVEEFRGNNGRLIIFVNKDYSDGVDTTRLDGSFVHNYGCAIWADRVQRLTGRPYISDNYDGRNNYASSTETDYPCPAVRLNRVGDAGEFRPMLSNCSNREGYRIGDAVEGLFPTKVDFILGGAMRSVDSLGRISGPNGYNGYWPTDKTLCHVERMEGGSITFPTIDGNIILGSGAQEVSLRIPASFIDRGYSIIKESGAYKTQVRIDGRTKFSHITGKSWIDNVDSVSVESVPDYAGLPAAYTNGKWDTGAALTFTQAQLESITSDANNRLGRKGLLARNDLSGKIMQKSGSNPEDNWVELDGVTGPITPVYLAATNALIARMSVAPSTAWKNRYDRILNDWAPLMPKMVLFYLLGAHDAQAGYLNWTSTSYTLTPVGSPAFVAGKGFLGNASSAKLTTGYTGGTGGETLNNIHIGVISSFLGNLSLNGEDFGSPNGAARVRNALPASTSNRANAGTNSSATSFVAQYGAPRHVVVTRLASGTQKVFENGVLRATQSFPSTGLPDTLEVLHGSSGYSDNRVMLAHYGLGLTDDEARLAASLSDDMAYLLGVA